MALPMLDKALEDVLQKAKDTPLEPNETTVMFQAWPMPDNTTIKVAVVAVNKEGHRTRVLWGPANLEQFINSETLDNLNLEDTDHE